MEIKKNKYRKNSGIVLKNSSNLIFVGKRSDIKITDCGWQMPQGGVDHNETYRMAAARELSEEVGTTKFEIISETKKTYKYNFPDDQTHFGKDVVGQKQKWFLANFTGEDTDIKISHEFSQWKWMSIDELISMIVDFKKSIYVNVFNEFRKFFPK